MQSISYKQGPHVATVRASTLIVQKYGPTTLTPYHKQQLRHLLLPATAAVLYLYTNLNPNLHSHTLGSTCSGNRASSCTACKGYVMCPASGTTRHRHSCSHDCCSACPPCSTRRMWKTCLCTKRKQNYAEAACCHGAEALRHIS